MSRSIKFEMTWRSFRGRADQDDVDHQEDLRSRMLLSSLEV